MKKAFWLLVLLTVSVLAKQRWQHYHLDLSLVQPSGWTVTQGPVMVSLSPEQDWRGARRPSFKVTWQQTPPPLDAFQEEVPASLKSRGAKVISIERLKLSGHPCVSIRAIVQQKTAQFPTQLILVRMDDFYGYLITTECMLTDQAQAEPVFQTMISSLKLGKKIRKGS
jgi:hypothetical protein